MSSDYNKSILLGRLVRDPQVKFLSNERAVANFTIACGEKWKGADGAEKSATAFIECTAWGKLAEIIGQYCTKGKQILVDGKLRTETWEDKDSGKTRSKTVLVVREMQLLGGKGEVGRPDLGSQGNGDAPAASSAPVPGAVDNDDSDVPF